MKLTKDYMLRLLQDDERATYPRAGDYWDEMCNAVLVVLEVNPKDSVVVVKEKIAVPGGYSFDMDKAETWTLERFAQYLAYGFDMTATIEGHVIPKYWASVNINQGKDLVDEWKEYKKFRMTEALKVRLANVVSLDGKPKSETPTRDSFR